MNENEKAIYPIGSLIRAENCKAIVSGYDFIAKDNKLVLQYLVLPYPMGYTNKDDLRMVAVDRCELIECGYRGEMFSPLENYLQGMRNAADRFTAREIRQAIEQMKAEGEKK